MELPCTEGADTRKAFRAQSKHLPARKLLISSSHHHHPLDAHICHLVIKLSEDKNLIRSSYRLKEKKKSIKPNPGLRRPPWRRPQALRSGRSCVCNWGRIPGPRRELEPVEFLEKGLTTPMGVTFNPGSPTLAGSYSMLRFSYEVILPHLPSPKSYSPTSHPPCLLRPHWLPRCSGKPTPLLRTPCLVHPSVWNAPPQTPARLFSHILRASVTFSVRLSLLTLFNKELLFCSLVPFHFHFSP